MGWTVSAVFTQAVLNPMTQHINPGSITSPTGYSDIVATDTINVALYNNTGTPNKNDTAANICYLAGQWVTGNEVTGTNWAAGGQALTGKAYTLGTGTVAFTATNTSVSTATISGAYGDLVYDNSITSPNAKLGLCFNYFGGSQSVTAGTFTIQWNAAGVFNFAT
jgi:hypothetical protein